MGRGLPGCAVLLALLAAGCNSDSGGATAALGEVCGAEIICGAATVCFEFVCRAACIFNGDCNVVEEHCDSGICLPGSRIQCGNFSVEPGEECDDGNRFTGDGCAADCLVEASFDCTGEPSVCTTQCPNGAIDPGEECDDDNNITGDGCDDTCTQEAGYACGGEPSVCEPSCGDGAIDPLDECDDGDLDDGDGCSDNCQVESGWSCTRFVPLVCTPVCGDGMQVGNEGCDDGDQDNNDTCPDGVGGTCQPATCGDGFVNLEMAAEDCDDQNMMILDGCTSCRLEANWTCSGEPSICQCAVTYQDNDGDGTCLDSCAGLGWAGCGGNGTCQDSSGVAFCACNAGFQDKDNNGTCISDCTGQTCGGFGTCNDASGSPVCDCLMGYEDFDGDGVCDPDCNVTGCQNGSMCSLGDCICSPAFIGDECKVCRVYVDIDATGIPDGQTWATAHTDLHQALPVAGQGATIGGLCEVWVAEGVYLPWLSGSLDFYKIPPDVHLYGGFDGTEIQRIGRDPVANVTILDGRDDGMGTTPRVNRIMQADDRDVIDGFTFREAGRATAPRGAGIDISADSDVTVRNCIFSNLQASDGGAINLSGGMNVTIEDCRFENNQGGDGGAIIIDNFTNVAINRTSFVGNIATAQGGAIRGRSSQITITDSRFLNNEASDDGGAIEMRGNASNQLTIDRTTFAANIAGLGSILADGGAIDSQRGDIIVRDSWFFGNRTEDDGGVIFMRASNDVLTLERTVITGNRGGIGGGAIHAMGPGTTQAFFTNVLFAGNSSISGPLHVLLVDGNLSAANLTIDNANRTLPGFEIDTISGNLINSSLIRVSSPGEGILSRFSSITVSYCIEPGLNDFCSDPSCNTSNMMTGTPNFVSPPDAGGSVDTVVYDSVAEQTILTDNDATRTPGALVGLYVTIQGSGIHVFPIAANTANTLAIEGDLTRTELNSLRIQSGDTYQLLDYQLTSAGIATNSGTAMMAPPDDILGVTRDLSPDIGAFEYVP